MPDSFRVLTVCTANHCRSPLMEFALRRHCSRLGLTWTITSAGTRAEPGQPPHSSVQRLLDQHGDDHQGWVSRKVDREMLEGVDLVLTAGVEHRDDIVRLCPKVATRTFLLLPFARFWATRTRGLGTTDPAERQQQLAIARQHSQPVRQAQDLPDPFGRRYGAFQRTDRAVEKATVAITRS
jgi:protein-tyrosine phosphatase